MPALIAILFAQGDTSPVKAQDRSSALDARQIMEASIAATQRDWKARLHYTYMERDEDRRRDLAGQADEVSQNPAGVSWTRTDGSTSIEIGPKSCVPNVCQVGNTRPVSTVLTEATVFTSY